MVFVVRGGGGDGVGGACANHVSTLGNSFVFESVGCAACGWHN